MTSRGQVWPVLLVVAAISFGVMNATVAQSTVEPLNPWPGPRGPTADEIIKSLTPGRLDARGIHVGPAAPPAAAVASTGLPAVSVIVQFASGSADLTPQAVHVLDNLGKALTDPSLAAYRFRIEGHTDTVGTNEYNKSLSERRAVAVRDYLAGNYHIDPSRLQAIGMGKDGLLVPTPDQTPEPRNRRIQIVNLGS